MASVKWFKVGEHVQGAQPDPQGRVNISQLAAKYDLDPRTLELDNILVYPDGEGWTPRAVHGGDDREAPIVVTGRPAAGESCSVYRTGNALYGHPVSVPSCPRGFMRCGLSIGMPKADC
jgi:hypothetical protein